MEQLPYNDYGSTMRRKLGGRVQKLSIDAGFSCPNRDGKIATGGCTFCLGEAFRPSYCQHSNDIHQQIESALHFHAARGRRADYFLAYLQSGSNTYSDINTLERIYSEALSHPAIAGLIIGTRPDCINSEILQILEHLSHRTYIAIEYGIESVYDTTLRHVNRGHDFATAARAVAETNALGIDVGAHFIIGLPNESDADIIEGVQHINTLGIDFVKFHQLQIYHHTAMECEWREHPERFPFGKTFDIERYSRLLVDIIRRLDPHIAIERFVSQAPRHLIAHSPLGGVRPDEVRNAIINHMTTHHYTQGDLLSLFNM
ncbi:MAG: TIGR01212 family radical SAM protein [Alistipes sp.]|nr:TIGR01212 family radical SAM protein [Alistipes sp.]